MKRSILLMTLMGALLMQVYSQENKPLSNKKGIPLLPAAGDIGFGLSANPFFNYAGNLFSSSGSNSLYLALPGTIYGKYFLDSKTAVRVKLYIYRYADKVENMVPDDENADLMVTDVQTYVNSDFELTFGIEKRSGSTRLQLFYGAEVGARTGKLSSIYEYGNAHDIGNTTPTSTTDFNSGAYSSINSRIAENTQKDGLGVRLRAFAGLEYFVLPKISVGGEFGLSYLRYFGGKSISTNERWDFGTNELVTDTQEMHDNYAITASDISSGNIFILIYF